MKKNLNSCGTCKSATIKKRAIFCYLPTFEMVDKWKGLADGLGVSISKFVIEHVENSLRQKKEKAIGVLYSKINMRKLKLYAKVDDYLAFILTNIYKANITNRYASTLITIKTFVKELAMSKSVTR